MRRRGNANVKIKCYTVSFRKKLVSAILCAVLFSSVPPYSMFITTSFFLRPQAPGGTMGSTVTTPGVRRLNSTVAKQNIVGSITMAHSPQLKDAEEAKRKATSVTLRGASSNGLQQESRLQTLGSAYGGWTYDTSNLSNNSIVYSIGLGLDTSWDEAIMARHGLQVWGYDPTPKALRYVQSRNELKTNRFHLVPEGLSTTKRTAVFTLPENPDHVSMREGDIADLGGTVSVQVNTLENWMATNMHTHIDILKMDIEGSEYDVIEDWIARDWFPFDQLLVEWHFRWLKDSTRHKRVLRGLKNRGWKIAYSQNKGQEQTFLR